MSLAAPVAALDRPEALPGVALAVRAAPAPYLVADLEDGALLLDPGRLILRAGADLEPVASGLARAWGTGRLVIGGARGGSLVVRVAAGATVVLAPGALMAAAPVAEPWPLVGQHGEHLLALRAPDDGALWLVLAAGAAAHRALGPGEALDCAPGGLLLADAAVDLAAGAYEGAPPRRAFVQCLGPGLILVRRGGVEG